MGLRRALYLADSSAKQVYDNLKESGYYAGVISGNMSQRITTDSIAIDLASYPFHFRFYGTETITRRGIMSAWKNQTSNCSMNVKCLLLPYLYPYDLQTQNFSYQCPVPNRLYI